MALSWVPWRDNQRVQRAENNNPSMKSGESGEPVHLLQAALVLQGFDIPHHGVTGNPPRQNNNFLGETQAAVRQCEARFGLTVDVGVAGQEVVRRLDQENNSLYTTRAGHFGAALARSDVGRAIGKITQATLGLTFLNANVLPTSTTTLVNDALRVHFRLLPPGSAGDGIRRARTAGDIDRILNTYRLIGAVFASNATSFVDGIPVNGVKTAAEANTGSRRVLFGPAFRDFTLTPVDLTGGEIGPNSRAAILIHEGMHAADDSGTSGNANIHISEFDPPYDTQRADLALFNPSSYAGFAAHIANNGDPSPRFGLGPGARRL
jgi:peptidoglycan hydrolase-like protein with peptidoglycan-binding domain